VGQVQKLFDQYVNFICLGIKKQFFQKTVFPKNSFSKKQFFYALTIGVVDPDPHESASILEAGSGSALE
jgi:hypothetical protein